MIIRIVFAFILFAGVAYYFNIDVRALVDQSGAPEWLAAHGIPTRDPQTAVAATGTTEATTSATTSTP